jgi:hypothetical protein
MTSWLRVLGLRVAVLCGLVATVVTAHVAVPKAGLPVALPAALPVALIESLDRAFSLAYDAAERKVAALETGAPAPPRHDLLALLCELERCVGAACDAATVRLDVELAVAGSLSMERRAATLGCIERQLREARLALQQATDPWVRAEYHATCERLREVRRLV